MAFSLNLAVQRRRGQLVNWVKKASLERIRRLLEITEAERNHELLLSVKNLRELGANPFSYIVPVIPCPLPTELVKREHFYLPTFSILFLEALRKRVLLKPGSSKKLWCNLFGPTNYL